MDANRTVLISGAGIAGNTLAYWLARNGFSPTVVERSAGTRSSGSPVDVAGPAFDVVERMGVVDELRAADTGVDSLVFVDTEGNRVGGIAFRRGEARHIELARSTLADVLQRAAEPHAEYLFHDSITALDQHTQGVDVTFSRARPRRFDLVVGADGLHSAVRRLAFGPESEFVRHIGMYVATVRLDEPVDDPTTVLQYNVPGRAVTVHPAGGAPAAAFIFRNRNTAGFDYRDSAQHKRLLAAAYAGGGWRTAELLDVVRDTDDLYFDAVSTVTMRGWARGRIALVGDAASAVSLLGNGSSNAIVGGYTLAEALAAQDGRQAAFARYQAEHRAATRWWRHLAPVMGHWLVPASGIGLAARNVTTRLLPG